MSKVVFIAKVDSHILNFHLPYLKYFYEKGYETVVISEGNEKIPYVSQKFDIKFGTNPLSINIFRSYIFLKKYLNSPDVALIHTHTAIASAISRIVIDKENFRGKIIYTSHGFHFMKDGPILNWLYYLPEKKLSSVNDILITINEEDFELAQNKFKTKKMFLIPGIGVPDSKIFKLNPRENSNLSYLFNGDKFTITYIAELNHNKNQIGLLKVFKSIANNFDFPLQLLLVGEGSDVNKLKREISNLEMDDNVHLLGFQNDIGYILHNTDLYVSTSSREGLGLNVIEALLNGVPAIVSNIRGHREIVTNNHNGYLYDSEEELEKYLKLLIENRELLNKLSVNTVSSVEKYRLRHAFNSMIDIYEREIF